MLLNFVLSALLIMAALSAGWCLYRGTGDGTTAFALRLRKALGHAGESRPGLIVNLTGDAPITLRGFDPQKEVLLVQLPDGPRDPDRSEGFSFRSDHFGRGTDLLYRDRVIVRLPDVGQNRNVDVYVENHTT